MQTLKWKPHRTKIIFIDFYRKHCMKKRNESERELSRYACALGVCVWYIYWLLSLAKSSSSIRLPFYTWTEHTLVLQIIITDGLLFSFVLCCSILICSARHARHSRSRSPAFYSWDMYVRVRVFCCIFYEMDGATLEAKYVFYLHSHNHREHNCFKIESRGEYCMGWLVNVSLSL